MSLFFADGHSSAADSAAGCMLDEKAAARSVAEHELGTMLAGWLFPDGRAHLSQPAATAGERESVIADWDSSESEEVRKASCFFKNRRLNNFRHISNERLRPAIAHRRVHFKNIS